MGRRRGGSCQIKSMSISKLKQRECVEVGSGMEYCSDIEIKGGNVKKGKVGCEDEREKSYGGDLWRLSGYG